ncbi:hypothetical protein P12x_005286 [Tundrisphaera lichenicola]|uniref:hypothetical protein n=1 Tax=Tundrisphaera lichenicola TaxID=2029860 RepID=UPI003EC0DDF9
MANYTAEAKRYDPDDEIEAEFDSLEKATEWLGEQSAYGFPALWLNNKRVCFENGELVELNFRTPSLSDALFGALKPPTREELERILRSDE